MRRSITIGALALISLAIAAQSAARPDAGSSSAEIAVISLDYQGSRLKRIDDSPTLSIYADGRVVMPRIYAHARAYQGRISPAEVQALLDFAIRDQQFLSFDEATVKAKVASQPGAARSLPEHLATTVISIRTPNASKSVSYFGLGHDKLVAETRQLLAIRSRLDRVMSVVKLGGTDEAKRWLELANAEVSKQASHNKPLTLNDLQSAAMHADGSAHVRFARIDQDAETSVSATISVDAAGVSHIAVVQDDLLPRQAN
jgi:hypothetical protein